MLAGRGHNYKMSLFCPHNERVHSAFWHWNESSVLLSVHESMCSLPYFVDTMLRYSVSWFHYEFTHFVTQKEFCPWKACDIWRPILIAVNTAGIFLIIVGCDIPDLSPISCWKVLMAKNPNMESTYTGTGRLWHSSVGFLSLIEVPNCGIIPKEQPLGDENVTFHEKIPAVVKNSLVSYGHREVF